MGDRRRPRHPTLSACLTLTLMGLALPAAAPAAPTVMLSPRAVPIPKNLWEPTASIWPHTGDMAGAGAELEARFTIAGTEDAGLPAPLRHVAFYLPRGAHVQTRGFAKCQHPALMPRKGPPCLNGAFASVPGPELDMVNFGGTDARSQWAQGAFFPTSGTLGFWTRATGGGPLLGGGYNPGSLTPTTGGYSYKVSETLPRRTAVDFSRDISTVSFDLTLGAARMSGGKLVSVLTMPKLCPAGGLPVKAELSFGDGDATSWETVAIASKLPCQ